jgi:hypothetical protein
MNMNVKPFDVTKNESLGEMLYRTWTVLFPQLDSADRRLILSVKVGAFYTDDQPEETTMQEKGQDPFQPLDELIVGFHVSEVKLICGKAFRTNQMTITND